MRQYLEDFVSRKYAAVCEELEAHAAKGRELCYLQGTSFADGSDPDYSRRLLRNVYLLRYGVAYFTEYYRVYQEIFSRFHNNCGQYALFSVGSGAHLDKTAAALALWEWQPSAHLTYIGLDRVNWADDVEQSITPNCSVEELTELPSQINCNILAFPKSISELDSVFLWDMASRVTSEQILLVFSLRKGDAPSFGDCRKINDVLRCFLERDYGINQASRVALGGETIFQNLGYNPYFGQNEAFEIVAHLGKRCCERLTCEKECGEGLGKYPMTKPKYFWDCYYLLEKIDAAPATANPYCRR
ncbi:MAG TPA: hypothetical protein H9784_02250 [Candidatus Desulfovibrio intestinavium]|uniref:Uncharacterized protein n=1 Tax=Candidatus Desulfovibrio intestinavium TaxID=2838534 RepID=A0A9D2HMJ7_9BACT|nr:hypothetical protein [Candidatus Desulfovibrio intestinavium]